MIWYRNAHNLNGNLQNSPSFSKLLNLTKNLWNLKFLIRVSLKRSFVLAQAVFIAKLELSFYL